MAVVESRGWHRTKKLIKMNLLAVETSSGCCSVCSLSTGDAAPRAVLASDDMMRGHAEAVIPMIKSVMSEAGLAFSDIDRLAVSTGPGTFTGVRVGLSVVRAIALAISAPVVGIASLEIVAARAKRAEPLLALPIRVAMPAGRGHLYVQDFDADASPTTDVMAVACDAAGKAAPQLPVIIAGAGSDILISAMADPAHHIRSKVQWPDAETLAAMAATRTPASKMPVPNYVRPPDAEPQIRAT